MLICNSGVFTAGILLIIWIATKNFTKDQFRRLTPIVVAAVLILSGISLATARVLRHSDWMQFCSNEVFKEIRAPLGQRKAVFFNRGCGALDSSYTTQISILAPNEKIDVASEGNIFIAENEWSERSKRWHLDIDAKWQSPNILVLQYPKSAKVYRSETIWKGIKVNYVKR